MLLRFDDERRWLRAASARVGHLFPRLLGQSEYNQRVKAIAPLMEAALRWLADQTPGSAEMLRLMDATPIPCGQSALTAKRSDLFGWAGYGYCPSHSRWYWGAKLLLIVHLRRDRDRVQPGQPQTGRRTRAGPHHAGAPARQPPGPRHRHRHR